MYNLFSFSSYSVIAIVAEKPHTALREKKLPILQHRPWHLNDQTNCIFILAINHSSIFPNAILQRGSFARTYVYISCPDRPLWCDFRLVIVCCVYFHLSPLEKKYILIIYVLIYTVYEHIYLPRELSIPCLYDSIWFFTNQNYRENAHKKSIRLFSLFFIFFFSAMTHIHSHIYV